MLITATSARIMEPLAVLGKVRFAFVIAMAVPLTLRTPSGLLLHFPDIYLFARYIEPIADGVVGSFRRAEEQFQMS
jgi:hypothetical protein